MAAMEIAVCVFPAPRRWGTENTRVSAAASVKVALRVATYVTALNASASDTPFSRTMAVAALLLPNPSPID